MSILIEVDGLEKYFPVGTLFQKKKFLHAVDGVDFHIKDGEAFALVGESGCGKTTLGKILLLHLTPTAGTVRFMGQNVFRLSKSDMKQLRRKMQMVFQDPFSSMNPRKNIHHILSQPYLGEGLGRDKIENNVLELLERVGLSPPQMYMDRYPNQLSGGQVQRIAIARAIALRPRFIVADESVSTLDVSLKAQILDLLRRFQEEFGLTLLFITHDLAVVRSMCKRIAVMYLGKFVEVANVEELYENPLHPYTKAMLSATPVPDPEIARIRKRIILKGDVPSPIDLPPGCRFQKRCPYKHPACEESEPKLIQTNDEHFVACHRI